MTPSSASATPPQISRSARPKRSRAQVLDFLRQRGASFLPTSCAAQPASKPRWRLHCGSWSRRTDHRDASTIALIDRSQRRPGKQRTDVTSPTQHRQMGGLYTDQPQMANRAGRATCWMLLKALRHRLSRLAGARDNLRMAGELQWLPPLEDRGEIAAAASWMVFWANSCVPVAVNRCGQPKNAKHRSNDCVVGCRCPSILWNPGAAKGSRHLGKDGEPQRGVVLQTMSHKIPNPWLP